MPNPHGCVRLRSSIPSNGTEQTAKLAKGQTGTYLPKRGKKGSRVKTPKLEERNKTEHQTKVSGHKNTPGRR